VIIKVWTDNWTDGKTDSHQTPNTLLYLPSVYHVGSTKTNMHKKDYDNWLK